MSDEDRVRRLVDEAAPKLWPGTVLESVVPMQGDASTRRYLRCHLAGDGPHAPSTCIAMLMASDTMALSSEELSVLGPDGPDELPFLNVARYLDKITDAIPRIYWTAADASALLLEDVGDLTLWEAAGATSPGAEQLFESALDLLCDLQDRARDDGSGCYAFRQSFDARLYNWEFDHFIEYGIGAAPPALVAACKRELAVVADRLAATETVFCHRDYHAWNIHLQGQRLRVLDFQDALLANPFYDVASLLSDRCTPELIDSEMEMRLLYRYMLALPPGHPAAGDDPTEMYNLCGLQRALKVIGRFHYLADVKGKPGYLEFLGAVGSTAKRLCGRVEGLTATADLLEHGAKLGDTDSAAEPRP